MDDIKLLYKTWQTLNRSRNELHKEISEANLWSVEHARKAYHELEKASEDAWVHYLAARTGVSYEQAGWEMNQAYTSWLD